MEFYTFHKKNNSSYIRGDKELNENDYVHAAIGSDLKDEKNIRIKHFLVKFNLTNLKLTPAKYFLSIVKNSLPVI